jgi:hypothetical protein
MQDQDMSGPTQWDGILYENDKCTIELVDEEEEGGGGGMQVDDEL